MAHPSAFTEKAEQEITKYLVEEKFREATMISSMYLHTRLSTLVRRGLDIDNELGRTKFKKLFEDQTLGPILDLSYRARMITKPEKTRLQKFIELRNDVAHDFEMWQELGTETKDAIRHWCNYVLGFMEATDDRRSPVREESPPQEPAYLNYESC